MGSPISLLCPACGTLLESAASELCCSGCWRHFPVVVGVPDLRLRPDRYLDLEADRAKARRLVATGPSDFAGLVRHYWAMTPEVPPHLAERYATNVIAGPRRAAAHLDAVGHELAGRRVLDVGCGTGGLLVAAARRGAGEVVGVDLALRWLVVAARHLRDAGVDGLLVAADGGALPFAPGAFDLVTCVETVEHAEDPPGLVAGCLQATAPGGDAYLVVTNRWSMAPEPHVGLWGVGLLPRRLAPAYVSWRRGTGYDHVRPVSPPELRRLVPPGTTAVVRPAVLPPVGAESGWGRRILQWLYHRVRRQPVLGALLRPITPLLELSWSRAQDAGQG